MKNAICAVAVALVVVGSPVQAGGHASSSNTIVDVAASAGQFGTLLAAAKAAGLADALAGEGPLTVFAPTDDAFAALPEGTVETLLKPENKDQLVSILTYHVAPARLKAADVVGLNEVDTLNGQSPAVTVNGSRVKINDANVVKVDIMASNGIIHVIDKVLLPPEQQAAVAPAMQVIEQAIARGAPLYNAGHARACSEIYQMAAVSLLAYEDTLDRRDRRRLTMALDRVEKTHSQDRRAWIMRDALDAVYHGSSMPLLSAR
ncbi:MAG: fasciclin domain-containing protein [Pseudomonadota bacterium]